MRRTPRFLATFGLACLAALAAVTPLSAQMGPGLTPLGGERAPIADGTIPAWDGGITKPPTGYTPGRHYVDPFTADRQLVTITPQNAEQYAASCRTATKRCSRPTPHSR